MALIEKLSDIIFAEITTQNSYSIWKISISAPKPNYINVINLNPHISLYSIKHSNNILIKILNK